MTELAVTYSSVLTAWVVMALLYLTQAIVADVTGIRTKATPGVAPQGGHDDPMFRATRAQANTNENLPVFIMITAAAMALGNSPAMTAGCAWVFVGGRALHMLAYYADLRPVRSGGFVISFIALCVLAVDLGIEVLL